MHLSLSIQVNQTAWPLSTLANVRPTMVLASDLAGQSTGLEESLKSLNVVDISGEANKISCMRVSELSGIVEQSAYQSASGALQQYCTLRALIK